MKKITNKNLLIELLHENPAAIEFASDELLEDKDVIEAATIDDESLLRELIEEDESLYRLASERIKNDKNITMRLLGVNTDIVEFVKDEFKNDPEVMDAAMENDPVLVFDAYAGEDLRKNKDFIMNHIVSLSSCSDEIRNDKDFILKLVDESNYHNPDNHLMRGIGKELRNNKEFIGQLLKRCSNNSEVSSILQYSNREFMNDSEFKLSILTENTLPFILAYGTADNKERISEDREFLITVMKKILEEKKNDDSFGTIYKDDIIMEIDSIFRASLDDMELLAWCEKAIESYLTDKEKEMRRNSLAFIARENKRKEKIKVKR